MVSFRSHLKLSRATPRLVVFRDLIKVFQPFSVGLPPGFFPHLIDLIENLFSDMEVASGGYLLPRTSKSPVALRETFNFFSIYQIRLS